MIGNNQWRTVQITGHAPCKRLAHSACVYNNKLLIHGGCDSSHTRLADLHAFFLGAFFTTLFCTLLHYYDDSHHHDSHHDTHHHDSHHDTHHDLHYYQQGRLMWLLL